MSSARDEPSASDLLIGRSTAFRRLRRSLERLAGVSTPVLLHGETGTGKELAARLLHETGPRRDGPFVAVNCAAIPEGLAESELFGHVRGAFTGATRTQAGAFTRAHTGTLFLDEVAELPPALQAKLLRVLERGRVLPVGADQEQEVDARVVSATHQDLANMIARGRLREDLYHRLGVLIVELPPLRQRPEDVPLLLAEFARAASRELGLDVRLTPQAIEAACHHHWPGNIRALRNAVYRAAMIGDGLVRCDDLIATAIPGHGQATGPVPGTAHDGGERPRDGDGMVTIPRGDYRAMRRALLQRILDEQGSIRRAALALDVPRSTLGTWLKARAKG